jgi:O-methyltransferase
LIKNTKKNIYLFDTFEGLPEDTKKNKEFTPSKGWLANTNLEKVKKFLLKTNINSKKLKIIKGIFPSTLNKEIKKEKFSLVHLDTDLFQSTYDGLNFFYPRLIKYGCIISHDYSSFGCPGVKMAFDEFVSENRIEHKLLQISQSQVLLLK